eukprot:SAG31_NODE_23732_length_497_cov_1.283920_1_plen_84_part_00
MLSSSELMRLEAPSARACASVLAHFPWWCENPLHHPAISMHSSIEFVPKTDDVATGGDNSKTKAEWQRRKKEKRKNNSYCEDI